ncbi:hypothetical protein F4703DRAFT_1791078 [Phycomyces blakesleeanus]
MADLRSPAGLTVFGCVMAFEKQPSSKATMLPGETELKKFDGIWCDTICIASNCLVYAKSSCIKAYGYTTLWYNKLIVVIICVIYIPQLSEIQAHKQERILQLPMRQARAHFRDVTHASH